jgi:hypothetical protein
MLVRLDTFFGGICHKTEMQLKIFRSFRKLSHRSKCLEEGKAIPLTGREDLWGCGTSRSVTVTHMSSLL